MSVARRASTGTGGHFLLFAVLVSICKAGGPIWETVSFTSDDALIATDLLVEQVVPGSFVAISAHFERMWHQIHDPDDFELQEVWWWLRDMFTRDDEKEAQDPFRKQRMGNVTQEEFRNRGTGHLDKMILSATVCILVLIDFAFFQNLNIEGFRGHAAMVCFWVFIGLAYNAMIFELHGKYAGIEWFSGYALEWLLSMDNLFVFHLIFKVYGTPKEVIHKALFCGIFGAVLSRMCFFAVITSLLKFVHWIRFVFGILLIYSGVQAAHEDDEPEVADTAPMRFLKACLGPRLVDQYDTEGKGVFMFCGNKLYFTLLLPVIFCLEVTDLLFALDSVTAKSAQIPDYWISVSSSVLAMFGLRAMFFIIQDLVDCFDMLKYGLCFILVFIGLELMISDYVKLSPQVVLIVILSVFLVCAAGSTAKRLKEVEREQGEADVDCPKGAARNAQGLLEGGESRIS